MLFGKKIVVEKGLREEIYNEIINLEKSGVEIIKHEIPEKKRYTKEWYEFLKNLGESVITLNRIHNLIINEHPYFKTLKSQIKETDKRIIEKKVAIFYMNLILSKLKSFFFTETPQSPKKDLRPKYLQDIIYYITLIFDNPNEKDFIFLLYAFYYKVFIMFDFLYCEEDENGVFPIFGINKCKNSKTIKLIFEKLNNLFNKDFKENISKYREGVNNIIKEVIKQQLGNGDGNIKKIYCKYINNVTNFLNGNEGYNLNNVEIEPISYYFAFKLWKIKNLMVHRIEEDENKKTKIDKDFEEMIKKYLDKNKRLNEKFYKIYKFKYSEFKFKKIYKEFFMTDKDFIEFYDKFDMSKEIKTEEIKVNKTYFSSNKESVVKAIQTMLSKDENDKDMWKFNRLLSDRNVEIKNILSIVYSLAKLINNNDENIDDYIIIGMYKSGALLAHLLNIIFSRNKNIFLFTSYPFIKLHPWTIEINEKKNKNSYLIIDENFKTGFTYCLVREFINGFYSKRKNEFKILSITTIDNFKKIDKNLDLNTIANIKYDNEVFEYKEGRDIILNSDLFEKDEILMDNVGDIKKYINEHLITKEEDIKSKILEVVEIDSHYYDLTRVLTYTKLMFSVAQFFKEKIIRKLKIDKNKEFEISLHSPTDEGRLLSEAIAFLFRLDNYKKLKILFNKNTVNKKDIFVDLSKDTGKVFNEYKAEKELDKVCLELYIGVRADMSNNGSNIYHLINF
jgi:hypothetical protein